MPRTKKSSERPKTDSSEVTEMTYEVPEDENLTISADEAPDVITDVADTKEESPKRVIRNTLNRPVVVFVDGVPIRLNPKQVVFID